MPLKKKGKFIALAVILVICLLPFFGFKGLVSLIRSQRTCDWANIDNIELHAHIDIPKVTKWDCSYEKGTNTKRASFTIDNNRLDVNRYIHLYKLRKISGSSELEYGRFLNLKKDSLSGSDLYYQKTNLDGERSDVLLDRKTGRLWVTIKYKD